jgi:ribosomal 50S subunit-recycling heat shock protein
MPYGIRQKNYTEEGKTMRIDKFLKVSRVIKRRTLAQEACEKQKVSINGKIAKPGSDVKEGDIVEIRFGENITRFRVKKVAEHVSKEEASEMIEIL